MVHKNLEIEKWCNLIEREDFQNILRNFFFIPQKNFFCHFQPLKKALKKAGSTTFETLSGS